MSQKKAAPAPAKKPAAAPSGKTETVAFDRNRLEAFVLGRITLGEMEGIGKDIQYQMAQKGYKMLAEGKLDLAYNIFRGLLALDPYDSYFHTALGGVLQRQGKYPEAEHAYTLALKFNPYNSTALASRGEVRFQQGNVLEAAQDISKAIEVDPQGKDPATVRGRVLSMAIAEVIKDNSQAIMDTLAKASKGAPAKAGGKPAAAEKAAPAKAAKPAPAKKK